MKSIGLINGRVILQEGSIENHALLIEDGIIKAVVKNDQVSDLKPERVIDVGGRWISPGFIDIHTHGGAGYDFMDADPAQIGEILAWMAGNGVAGVLPTIASAPLEDQLRMVDRIVAARSENPRGARILGIHLEGPYFSIEKRGAQPEEALRKPDEKEVRQLIEASQGLVKMISLAPELPGALDLIRTFSREGIVMAAGHTTADYDLILRAVDAGLDHMIHLFNGMPPMHHRKPGPVGAALVRDDLFAEVILDGIHLHPDIVRIVLRAKGYQNVLLITDSTQAAGLEDGEYLRPGNRMITVKDGIARLENGSLAGSTLAMSRAVSNAVELVGLSIEEAVGMASRIPAESLGMDQEHGILAPGRAANLTVFNDRVEVFLTMVDGNVVFKHNTI